MQVISFETAKLAKGKGYLPPGLRAFLNLGFRIGHLYQTYDSRGNLGTRPYYNPENPHYLAPYQEELREWLRNEHNLHIVIIPTITCFWTYKIITLAGDIEQPPYKEVCASDYNTYEEALEAGLQEMLSVL